MDVLYLCDNMTWHEVSFTKLHQLCKLILLNFIVLQGFKFIYLNWIFHGIVDNFLADFQSLS